MASRKHLISFIVLICLMIGHFYAQIVLAGPTDKEHSVSKLVEWELTANSSLSSINKMAIAVLERVDMDLIPDSIKSKIDMDAFRSDVEWKRVSALQKLSLEDYTKLALLPAPIDYYEIPLSELKENWNIDIHDLKGSESELAKEYMFFKKNGKTYMRWFVHPLSDQINDTIPRFYRAFLREKGLPEPQLKRGDIQFHFTASRSLIIFRDSYEKAISLKMSLVEAGGQFKEDKYINLNTFRAWAGHNKYLNTLLENNPLMSMKLLKEPFGMGFSKDGFEDGFLFRSLEPFRGNQSKYLMPAFAVLHSEAGAEIARINGSSDPLEYWAKNFLDPMAKGMAELRAKTGAEHTSPHTQNLMVELDAQFKPTGKVVLRDFDFYVDADVFSLLKSSSLSEKGLVRLGPQKALFALRHGLKNLPSWMSEFDYINWIYRYYGQYEHEFSRVTGIPKSEIFNPEILTMFNKVPMENAPNNQMNISFSTATGYKSRYEAWLRKTTTPLQCPLLFVQ